MSAPNGSRSAFLLGPGWIVGVGNGLILGYLMMPERNERSPALAAA